MKINAAFCYLGEHRSPLHRLPSNLSPRTRAEEQAHDTLEGIVLATIEGRARMSEASVWKRKSAKTMFVNAAAAEVTHRPLRSPLRRPLQDDRLGLCSFMAAP